MFPGFDNYDVQETRREARAEERTAIAMNMLKEKMSIDAIVKVTGLTREEVENLQVTN